ncbi:MAG: hypothetical protein ACLQNV_08420 [Steroidobacteraceae bacterium]
MGPLPVNPSRFLIRLALVSMAVLWLAKQYSDDVVGMLLPLMRAEMLALYDNVSIQSLQISRENQTETVRLQANTVRPIYFKKFIVYPLGVRPHTSGWYQVDVNLRGALLSSVIFLIAIMSWPQQGFQELMLRMLIGLPFLAILYAVDAPLDLLGNFERVVMHSVDPDTTPFLFKWGKFLEGGGTAAIAFAFAAVVISLAARSARIDFSPRSA